MDHISKAEIKELAPELLVRCRDLKIDPGEEIKRLMDEDKLTLKQATVLFWRTMGATHEQAGRAAKTGYPTTSDSVGADVARSAVTLKTPKVRAAQNNIFRRYYARYGKELVVNRATIISDLEVLKSKATTDQHYSAAVRATELQARAAGISMSETIIVESDRLPDRTLIESIAGSDADLAAKLRAKLGAVDGEWTELESPQGMDSDDTTSNSDTDT